MEPSPPPARPPFQEAPVHITQKKGMGTGAKVGIGCGVVALLGIIAVVVVAVMFGGMIKDFTAQSKKNPTRAAATLMENMSGGKFKMIAEDDVNNRYTLKDESSGKMTTFYWDKDKKVTVNVEGDFSAIPTTPEIPAPEEQPER